MECISSLIAMIVLELQIQNSDWHMLHITDGLWLPMDRTEIYGWYRYSWCCFTHLMGKYPLMVHVILWINRLIYRCGYLMTNLSTSLAPFGRLF